ncbi:hypothetical protein NM688_g7435 [Phlebia brevispora]|uniref:Uncharacterized protein n=1 Tax=Phlebia brevispora TaxID=194682 RepID=A0ACC1S569_9APHY|nr:hypothetical protein NM688_g7435 [Phlebia brevispora]
MVDYVWVLHDFKPQEADEIPLKAGDRVQVVEKDDLYQDGWWKGINPAGKTGLFPKSYTTDQPPPPPRPQPAEDRSRVSFPNEHTPAAATPTGVHAEPTSTNGHTNGSSDERERNLSTGEMALQATLTDVQRAIEQLGRNTDNDGNRSFSFRSSHDDYSERSDTGTEDEDAEEDRTDWHRNAREKLALRAQLENQQRMRESTSVPSTPLRVTAPPIDVELSDESEDEEEEYRAQDSLKNQRRHSEGAHESDFRRSASRACELGRPQRDYCALSPVRCCYDTLCFPSVTLSGK